MKTKQHTTQLAVDVKVLARMLGCSERHIERLDSAGKLPSPVRLGRSVRWSVSEIEDWIAQGCPSRPQWEQERGES